jgi:hypothetical protein
MMATTHVFAGLAAVAPIAFLAPEGAAVLGIGAILGGIAPDFDLVFTHRRTLHFPVAGLAVAVSTIVVAALFPSPLTLVLAAFAGTAWLHAASDAIGGGPEMDPWNERTERAVYDHVHGRWIRPRRWIRYDGAPEDAALGIVLALPAPLIFDGRFTAVIAGCVAVSLLYTLFRRRLVAWTPDWLE